MVVGTERVALKRIQGQVLNRQPVGICCMIQEAQTQCSVKTQRGGKGREAGGRFKREGTYVYLWLIHVDVWQKTANYCKATTLQLKIKHIF